ncbi:MAG TPA: energy-coupling factor transporter transmembrane component T [Gaiellaceae bacterium]|nr:energy-coupling factor transporter transmembrane component T [Gaiellaceae bacterium]
MAGPGAGISPAPAAALLAGLAIAALLATSTWSVAVIAAALLVAAMFAPAKRRWPYLVGTLVTGLSVFVLTPFVEQIGVNVLWSGPTIPVIGTLDITTEELSNGLFQALRLVAVGLAFAVYALLLDHDRLLASAGWLRRSTVAVALATRLVPLLERDARDLSLAMRGRGVELGAVRQLSPLLAGSLERGLNLAEAMEARGYGRADRTRAPRPGWGWLDYVALAGAVLVIVVGALWL